MTPSKLALLAVSSILFSATAPLLSQELNSTFARDPGQPIDQQYTDQIHKYTTDPSFISPLVDYLPASKTVPTPAKVLGDVSGAPDMLPYAEDVYKYFRLLEAGSPRVKVFTIGHSEEGREMIAAAIADPKLLAGAKENDARLAQLADPRKIGLDDAKARQIIDQSWPVYYITGTIHSPETGAPTALMELAYRLAVDDAPYIKYIRSHMIVLITPVVEVDGRDRMVDIYKWHKAHPGQDWPRLLYWGHYVAHDNNRDAMAMTLDLTRNVLDTYLAWHAQVLHDLHESVPFLYDNTVGDGPYNAWVDPTLADEWAELGWNNVAQMQNFGMPGVFTHGDFDTWSPGYLMFLAGMHNGISRLYETFGNGGADTEKRILRPEDYSRTWYRQNPPLPVVTWSQRDNNNYEESALLSTLSYFSQQHPPFPGELLPQEQARGREAVAGRTGRLCDPRRPSRRESPDRVAQSPEAPACRDASSYPTRSLPPSPAKSAETSRSRKPSPPAASSSAWISLTPASPMPCSIASSGPPAIRRSIPTTTPDGPSLISSI